MSFSQLRVRRFLAASTESILAKGNSPTKQNKATDRLLAGRLQWRDWEVVCAPLGGTANGRPICVSRELLGTARRQRRGCHLDRATDLSPIRRHGAGHP